MSLALRWPSLGLPLDRDEGTYATLALAWSKHWGLPYVDFLDHKPPLLYILYALAFQVGGWTVGALRAFSLAWQAATAVAFAFTLRRWGLPAKQVWLASLAWIALNSAWGTQALMANAEGWAWLPLLAGLACLQPLQKKSPPGAWVAWGFFAGLAACIKQPFYVFALGLPLCLPLGLSRWKASAWAGLGLLVAHAPFIAALAAAHALAPAWAAVFAFHQGYGTPFSGGSLQHGLGLLRHLWPEEGALWALAWLAHASSATGVGRPALRRLALGCLLLGLLASSLSGRWYSHYAIFWNLGLALSVATAFDLSGSPAWLQLRRGLACLGLIAFVWAQWPLWHLLRQGQPWGSLSYAPEAAAWLQAHSAPEDRVFIWGAEAEIYFLAQRRPATRFLSHYSFTGVTPAWPGAEAELWQALQDPRTKACVLTEPVDAGIELQHHLGQELQKHFKIQRLGDSPFWVGLRRS